jgi:hypothetical protein
MARKKIAVIVIVIALAAFGLGTLVGYRRGRPRVGAPYIASGAAAGGETGGCVDFREAGSYAGRTGCVSGRVLRVFTSRAGNTFLDFCPDYRTCPFTSVIFASDRDKFGGFDALQGRQVELRGAITIYEGRAEVIIHDPQQIRVVP